MALGEGEETGVEAVDPDGVGSGEGDEGEERPAAHGGDVREGTGEGGVADVAGFGCRGEVAIEVHLVGGEKKIVTGFRTENGAIVTDAGEDAVAGRESSARKALFDFGDEVGFVHTAIVRWKGYAIGFGCYSFDGFGLGTAAGHSARGGG